MNLRGYHALYSLFQFWVWAIWWWEAWSLDSDHISYTVSPTPTLLDVLQLPLMGMIHSMPIFMKTIHINNGIQLFNSLPPSFFPISSNLKMKKREWKWLGTKLIAMTPISIHNLLHLETNSICPLFGPLSWTPNLHVGFGIFMT